MLSHTLLWTDSLLFAVLYPFLNESIIVKLVTLVQLICLANLYI